MTPDGTFQSAFWGIDGRTYTGRDVLAEYFQEMGEQWERYSMEILRIESAGDHVVAVCRLDAIEPDTNVAVAPEQALVFELEDGKARSIVTVANVDEALQTLAGPA
jgi:hypothetical protein